MKYLLFISIGLGLMACRHHDNANARDEVASTEKDFQTMATNKGVAEAFWFFADTGATIKRGNDSLIHGKDAIRNFYANTNFSKAQVTWSPDFVETSEDGTLAYTYGKYQWTIPDSAHKSTSSFKGVFHTVWKKQSNGLWKYVWD